MPRQGSGHRFSPRQVKARGFAEAPRTLPPGYVVPRLTQTSAVASPSRNPVRLPLRSAQPDGQIFPANPIHEARLETPAAGNRVRGKPRGIGARSRILGPGP